MKVYVVEVGAYSDAYIDAIFTTRELAEKYIEDQKRHAYEVAKKNHEAYWEQFPPDVRPNLMSRYGRELPSYEDWVPSANSLNRFGDIWEHDLIGPLPVEVSA